MSPPRNHVQERIDRGPGETSVYTSQLPVQVIRPLDIAGITDEDTAKGYVAHLPGGIYAVTVHVRDDHGWRVVQSFITSKHDTRPLDEIIAEVRGLVVERVEIIQAKQEFRRDRTQPSLGTLHGFVDPSYVDQEG